LAVPKRDNFFALRQAFIFLLALAHRLRYTEILSTGDSPVITAREGTTMTKRKIKETDDDLPPELRDDYQPLPGEVVATDDSSAAAAAGGAALPASTPIGSYTDHRQAQTRQPKQWRNRNTKPARPIEDVLVGDMIVQEIDNFDHVGIRVKFPGGRPAPPGEETEHGLLSDAIGKVENRRDGDRHDQRREYKGAGGAGVSESAGEWTELAGRKSGG
jgi:hypothetical protein